MTMYLPSFAIPMLAGIPWSNGAALAAMLAAFGLMSATSLAVLALRQRSVDRLALQPPRPAALDELALEHLIRPSAQRGAA